MDSQRLMSPYGGEKEKREEGILRPGSFDEYVGQKKVIDNIRVMVEASNLRGGPMDHCLLTGPPGLGKTSLAMIVAKTLGTELHVVSGAGIEKKGDLASVLANLSFRNVLFIDEIHRMHVQVEEILYSAMEDFKLDVLVGRGSGARTMRVELSPFTLIGATARSGLLSNPLRMRFMAHLHFDFYQLEDLARIVHFNAKRWGITLDKLAVEKISQCGRGTPRIAIRILRRVRDFALVEGVTHLGEREVEHSLQLMEIDRYGLDRMDRKILGVVNDYYKGGPVGIEALCATLAEDRLTVEDVFEPYLLKEGFLLRTPRGRMITDKAKSCLENA